MSYDTKIQSAREVLENHNSKVADQFKVQINEVIESLQANGGTSEEALSQCSYEDLTKFGFPPLLAKTISQNIFRKSVPASVIALEKQTYISDKKANMMTVSELLERYEPTEDNAISKRLTTLSKGYKCIAFVNGKVDVVASAKIFSDIKAGFPEIDKTKIGTKIVQLFEVGESPYAYLIENPIYPGRALRSGETCDQTLRSWENIPLKIRQLIYIARTITHELKINSVKDAHDIMDWAISDSAEEKITKVFTEASIKFDELEETGQLPLLKLKISDKNSEVKKNDTFYSNRQY